MSQQKPSFAEIASRIWEKVKEHPGYVVVAAAVIFMVHPKPFLRVLRPLVRHIANNYDELEYSETETIVLATRPLDQQTLYKSIGVDRYQSLRVLDYLRYRAQQGQIAQVWGSILCDHVRRTHTEVVVVLAQSNIIQQCEMSLYGMEQSERHKLNLLAENNVHVLVRCLSSYQLKELMLES